MPKENGATQLLDVVPGELRDPDPLDVHGVHGHIVRVQLRLPLMLSHISIHARSHVLPAICSFPSAVGVFFIANLVKFDQTKLLERMLADY
jgi:hypothetical protein